MTGKTLLAAISVAWSAAALGALQVEVGPAGLREITNEGVRLLAPGPGRDIQPFSGTPRIVAPDGSTSVPELKATVSNPTPGRIVQRYPWGTVNCDYTATADRLVFSLSITNTSRTDTIESLQLRLVELTFQSVPEGRTTDAGMFATGGRWRMLGPVPLKVDATQMPPVVFVRHELGLIAFASDEPDGPSLAIPFATGPSKLTYPLVAAFGPIRPQGVARGQVSLRFANRQAGEDELVADVFQKFRDQYPYRLDWRDRRPIGALFLATSQKHPEKNPRGWFQNAKDVDTTTPEGVRKWRERLMRYADTAIGILKDLGAQGMITWDPEGEEFAGAAYYGDPRLASRLAPETDFEGALDEYFRKFRDAGFATGLTIRPQAIRFQDGVPGQSRPANARDELLAKIEYARKRWGCTIFYVDSSYSNHLALDADIFKQILELHPDILMLPENEVFRHYAYGAPLNSFQHHNVTGSPPTVRKVYPRGFSTLLASVTDEKQMEAGRAELIQAVRSGDVMIVHAAYPGKHIDFVKSIYQAARASAPADPDRR